jgi:glycerate 2-kinase
MRVIVAPDCFGGTLTAVAAAAAIAEGWSRTVPDDTLVQVPVSDGGPGFVDVLAAARLGTLTSLTVADPLGRPVPASMLLSDRVAYLESAQAAGLHLLSPDERNPLHASSAGVGQLVRAALDAGAAEIVIGLGGTAVNDGGAGLLGALGLSGTKDWLEGDPGPLNPIGLDPRLREVSLIAATDVDNPLLGLQGASAVYGPQKGATPDDVQRLDAALARWAGALRRDLGVDVANQPGAGAAGGLGAALFALGATRRSGIELVLAAVDLAGHIADADLVVTGEGSYDAQSLRGKAVSGVARAAAGQALPCLVLAGAVEVGVREAAAHGVDAAYATADLAGSADRSRADAAYWLSELAARVARQWSAPRG